MQRPSCGLINVYGRFDNEFDDVDLFISLVINGVYVTMLYFINPIRMKAIGPRESMWMLSSCTVAKAVARAVILPVTLSVNNHDIYTLTQY